MKELLLKEYHANRSTYIITIILFSLLAWVVIDSELQISAYALVFLLGAYLFSASYVDDQNGSHVLINSLPVSRMMVISAKYISALLTGLMLLLLTAAINAVIPQLTTMTVMNIAEGIAVIMIVTALYYPLYIIIGARFMGYVLTAAVIAILYVGPTILQSDSFAGTIIQSLGQLSTEVLITVIIITSTVILIVSWIISIRVYKAKQF